MKNYADELGCYPPQQVASKTCIIIIPILSYWKFAKTYLKPQICNNYVMTFNGPLPTMMQRRRLIAQHTVRTDEVFEWIVRSPSNG